MFQPSLFGARFSVCGTPKNFKPWPLVSQYHAGHILGALQQRPAIKNTQEYVANGLAVQRAGPLFVVASVLRHIFRGTRAMAMQAPFNGKLF